MTLLEQGVQLFNGREFFRCHEVLETEWTAEPGPRRMFLQALIHIAVAFHHLQQGNALGARLQLDKGMRKLKPYVPSCEGLDTLRLLGDARAVWQRLEAGETSSDCFQIHWGGVSSPPHEPTEGIER